MWSNWQEISRIISTKPSTEKKISDCLSMRGHKKEHTNITAKEHEVSP